MVSRVIQAKLLKMKKARRLFPRYLSAEAVAVSRFDANHPLATSTRKFRSPDVVPGDSDIRISNKKLAHYARQVGIPLARAREVVEEMNALREQQLGLDHETEDTSKKQFNSMAQAKAALRAQPTVVKPTIDKARGSVYSYNSRFKKPDKTYARPEFYEPSDPIAPMLRGPGTSVVEGMPSQEEMLVSGWRNWKRQGVTLFVRMNVVERTGYSLDLWFYQDKVYYIELDFNKKLGRRSRNYHSVNRAQKEMDHIGWVEVIPIE